MPWPLLVGGHNKRRRIDITSNPHNRKHQKTKCTTTIYKRRSASFPELTPASEAAEGERK
jgi:hypothetical protein